MSTRSHSTDWTAAAAPDSEPTLHSFDRMFQKVHGVLTVG